MEAIWALGYYFGSVVRYRPHRFERLADGPFGPFVDEFISVQTEQMLYLLASEICRREIARPAIVWKHSSHSVSRPLRRLARSWAPSLGPWPPKHG